jgi:hypothetical protein
LLPNNEYATEVYDLRFLSDITNIDISLNNSDIDTINLYGGLYYHKSEKTDLVRSNQFGLLNTLTRQYNVSQSLLDWPHLPATFKEVNDVSKIYDLAGYYSNITLITYYNITLLYCYLIILLYYYNIWLYYIDHQ